MPTQQAHPTPAAITPALLKTHSITPEEYASIEQKLGRTPSLTELGIFSVMWSEHCSYKSSRVHLKRLPTKGTRTTGPGAVVQGPGENAGIIDVGDGWACAFKIESHNHPSYIEPYQGAATGVGGILRDIFTMGARPLAVMDSLRFGPLQPEQPSQNRGKETGIRDKEDSSYPLSLTPYPSSSTPVYAKNREILTGVVHGVGGYGNCFGVPNLGGETRFEPCYSGNPLLNAFALGLVRTDEIFYAKAEGVGNPVFYVGAKTGRDGIHGATMASEEFTEGSEQKRPNVQMGDPFLEKLLLEACLEVMKTGAVLGIQDMGAAGLTCSTCEMGARGALGVTIELDRVPQRETGMTSYEIMLSESQERMLLVAEKGREAEVLAVFAKWGLDCAEVGTVTADDVMRVFHHGVLEAEIPNKALTDEAPVYHRPVGTWTAPVPKDPPAWVLEELKKPRDYTADLKRLLASPNICSKHWIYEQYDSMVQTNTVQGPGGEAGVIRIKGTGTPRHHAAPLNHSEAEGNFAPVGTPATQPFSHSNTHLPPPPQNPEVFNLDPTLNPALDPTQESFSAGFSSLTPELAIESPTEHPGFLSKLVHLIAESTPKGEATLETRNEDAANPVLSPGPTHESFPPTGAPGSTASSSTLGGQAIQKPERGLAMALAGNGRWCYLDPHLGAMHAVAEAARKVACTGATPVAATNCLNFGNPEKPEIMAQLSQAIDGIAEACTALNVPITGGNVSLYNETKGEAIYPTPVIGVVGILDDVTKAVPNGFHAPGEAIVWLTPKRADEDRTYEVQEWSVEIQQELGSTMASCLFGEVIWGTPPYLCLRNQKNLLATLIQLSKEGLASSAQDVGSGGMSVALAKACLAGKLGAYVTLLHHIDTTADSCIAERLQALFADAVNTAFITCETSDIAAITAVAEANDYDADHIGSTGGDHLVIACDESILVDEPLVNLDRTYFSSLESQLAEEVLP